VTTPDRRRRRARWAGALLAGGLAVLGACASQVVVREPPPAPKDEADSRPLKPGPGVFWQSGRWAWSTEKAMYYWVAGTWAAERAKRIWLPGYWEEVRDEEGRGWVWVEPRWEKTDVSAPPR